MTADPSENQTSAAPGDPSIGRAMSRVYHWGGRIVGLLLWIGLVLCIASGNGVAFGERESGASGPWFRVTLPTLGLVPIVSLAIFGAYRIRRDPRGIAGWLSVGLGAFLIWLWTRP